ncbi:MAG: hypothetical protein PHE55_14470, partial [Methylococcaceae bacterium]|nr:hypothetical protein [Methylococcaceae bacterium]
DSLKALANLVLARNQVRNRHATKTEKPRNFDPEKTPQKLHEIAAELREVAHTNEGKITTQHDPVGINALAQTIADECGTTAEQALSMLDSDDCRDIENGDQGLLASWKGFVGLAQRQRIPDDLPESELSVTGELWALLRTPAGGIVRVRARDASHLDYLRKLNRPRRTNR